MMRILIVDDSDLVRRGVVTLLSSRPAWKVCGTAENGEEALQKATELNPHLVLLDLNMPGIGGLDVARALRREIPKVKIVIMSQHDTTQLLPKALEAGANACIDKNCLSTDLLPAIEALNSNSRAASRD
jgi:two-component system invasion response regulator UvrY